MKPSKIPSKEPPFKPSPKLTQMLRDATPEQAKRAAEVAAKLLAMRAAQAKNLHELIEPALPDWTLCGGIQAPYRIAPTSSDGARRPTTNAPDQHLSSSAKPESIDDGNT